MINTDNNWLYKLISRNKCNYRLKEEASTQSRFVDYLRILSLEGKLRCVWFAVCNEIGNAKKNNHYGSYLQMLGKISGAADIIFLWDKGNGCIEFKSRQGKQTLQQKLFQKWCETQNVDYKIAKTVDEAINIIKEWGILDKNENIIHYGD